MSTLLTTAHKQWATRPADQRFKTLDELQQAVANRRLRSRALDVDVIDIEAKEVDGELVINSALKPVEPSNWSFTQLAGVAGAPAAYLRKLPTDLVVQNLNHGFKSEAQAPDGSKTAKFMTVASEDGSLGTLQAVTSTTYGRIWDADVAEAVRKVVDRSEGRFHNPLAYVNNGRGFSGITGEVEPSGLYASDRDIFIFMVDGGSLLESGPRAQFHRGFYAWNSEVGSKTFGLTTFLFNQVCGNHFIYGARDVNSLIVRHTRGGPKRFDDEALPLLLDYANSSAAPELAIIQKAQELELSKLVGSEKGEAEVQEIVAWADKIGARFTRTEIQEARDYANREEGKFASLFDLTQGLTAYARGFEFVDARVDLERRAGQLLKVAEGRVA